MKGEREGPERAAGRCHARLSLFTFHFSLFTLFLLTAPAVSAQILDDTLAEDSLAQDTVDYTARFLAAQEQVGVRVPVLSRLEPVGPRPPGTRIVFTRDSIEWGHASTVSDLLDPGPRRLPLARRVHRPARARQLPGARRDVGGVLPRRPALCGGRHRQRRGRSRALHHQLSRPHRSRALARPAPGPSLHPAARPSGASVPHRDRAGRRGLRALRGLAGAPVRQRHRVRPRGGLSQLADRERRVEQLLEHPVLSPGQLRPQPATGIPVPAPAILAEPAPLRGVRSGAQRHPRSRLRRGAHRRAVPRLLARGRSRRSARASTCSTGVPAGTAEAWSSR